jgi:exodeoxyribonuclease VII large subunit
MITVLSRRWPGVQIRLYPTQVQGEGAVEGICAGLGYFSGSGWAEVVIVGRGGGSLEDLWSFNEEAVARAIAACAVPVVSAVGHETDFTIADFVADLRAPTPSAAAEMVVRDRSEVLRAVEAAEGRAARAARFVLASASRRLTERGVERAAALLSRRIGRGVQRVDECEQEMAGALREKIQARMKRWREADWGLRAQDVRVRLEAAKGRAEQLRARLEALSPLGVLARGYAVVETGERRIVRDASSVEVGERISVRLAKGRLGAKVESTEAG